MKRIVFIGMIALGLSLYWGVSMAAKVKKDSRAIPLPVGVVEGFYGRPWTHEERLEMIRFMGEIGLNHYCYAPKDDPYHRKRWRDPYPEQELAKLRELVNACQRANVNFCFAISPGLDIEYSNPRELELLVAKLEPLAKAGVRWFALFFDDVQSTFTHESDTKNFASFAEAHVKLANDLLQRLRQGHAEASLIVCPTEYYHSDPTPYLTELSSKLHPEIPLVWTGLGVCSPKIDPSDLLRIREVTRRKPFLWDNYPVNDYDTGHIYLGPVRHRTPLLGLNLSGYWSNPMNEPELSKIPLLTIADFFRSPESYNPETSWRQALRRVAGQRAYPYMLRLADFMNGSFLTGDEGRVLCTLVGDFFEAPSPAAVSSLREYLQQLLDLENNLNRTLANQRLFQELRPSLKRLRVHVRNLQAALRIEEVGINTSEAKQLRDVLAQGLAALDSPVTAPAMASADWERLLRDETSVFPGNVADEVFAQLQQHFFSKWTRETSPTLPVLVSAPPAAGGNFGELAFDENEATFYKSRNPWKAGQYLAVDFRETLRQGATIRLTADGIEKWGNIFFPELDMEVSLDGLKWQKVGSIDAKQRSAETDKAFRFVRLIAVKETEIQVLLRELRVEPRK
ncbi:MAG: beta-N-acetylglucosaminidase domain-containing protein [Candidatus Sumerlaeaceae bacterium]